MVKGNGDRSIGVEFEGKRDGWMFGQYGKGGWVLDKRA